MSEIIHKITSLLVIPTPKLSYFIGLLYLSLVQLPNSGTNHNLEEVRKRPRKVSEAEAKPRLNSTEPAGKLNNVKKSVKVQHDESSDSDEPLIEKLRKNNTTPSAAAPTIPANTQPVPTVGGGGVKTKVKGAAIAMNTRRSVRANARSKGDKAEAAAAEAALRRKTRSAGECKSLVVCLDRVEYCQV